MQQHKLFSSREEDDARLCSDQGIAIGTANVQAVYHMGGPARKVLPGEGAGPAPAGWNDVTMSKYRLAKGDLQVLVSDLFC